MGRVVQRNSEFLRISRLPRRRWPPVPPELVTRLSEHLQTPHGDMVLRPWQAAALCEFHDNGGLFAQAGIGMGKTLLSYLAAAVIEAKRPLLLVPAKLREKTLREFRELRLSWKGVPIRVESYEMLSTTNKKTGRPSVDLDHYKPDCILLDEVHRCRDVRSKRTKKLNRYIREARKAGLSVRVMAMSGTIAKRSLRDFAHILEWCLPTTSPLPHDWLDLTTWSDAVDERVVMGDPVDPGVLLQLCTPEEKRLPPLDAARRAVGRRIFETPGAMATERTDGVAASLIIECHEVVADIAMENAFEVMKRTWTAPSGEAIADPIAMYRHLRECACGFVYKWRHPAPLEWLYARSDWAIGVRETIATNRRGLDSEFEVALEVSRNPHHPLREAREAWQKVKKTFEPETVPVWLSDAPLEWAAKWAASDPGLVWVEHVAVGERLAKLTGLPYYGAGGRDAKGRYIEDHPGGSAIASIASNAEGRNLQKLWSRALFMSFPPTGYVAEQAIGRLHRPGQEADEVVCDIMISCREQLVGVEKALRDASFLTTVLQSSMRLMGSRGSGGPTGPDVLGSILDGNRPDVHNADIILPTFGMRGWSWKLPSKTAKAA